MFCLLGVGNAVLLQQSYNGSTFIAEKTIATYQEVHNWCTALGGQLPSIHSSGDIDFIVDKLQMASTWLGAASMETGKASGSLYWTDGTVWNNLNEYMARSPCYSCCGLVLSITKKIVTKSRCDYTNQYNKVCRVPKGLAEQQQLKDQLNELDVKVTQRLSVEEIMYHELVNASLSHTDQLSKMEQLLTDVVAEVSQLAQEVQLIDGRRDETNNTLMEHVLSLNETMHVRLLQLHDTLNLSSNLFNLSINQQRDVYTSILRQVQDQMSTQSMTAKNQQDREISGLSHDVHRITVILVCAFVLFFVSILFLAWFKLKKRGELGEDEVRLSQINDSY